VVALLFVAAFVGLSLYQSHWERQRDRLDAETQARAQQELDWRSDELCEEMRREIGSGGSTRARLQALDAIGFPGFGDEDQEESVSSSCPEIVGAAWDLDEALGVELRGGSTSTPTPTPDVDEDAYEDCGQLGGWIASGQDSGRFTAEEYDSWLGILEQCFEEAGR